MEGESYDGSGIQKAAPSVVFGLLDIFRIENGEIVEQWGGPDVSDLLRQLESD